MILNSKYNQEAKSINYNKKTYTANMLLNRIINRPSFSIINKVRQHENLKKGILNRPVMKSHLIDDFVGKASY